MFVQTVLILHLMGMFFCVSRLKDLSGQMVFFNPVCLCPLSPILHPFFTSIHSAVYIQVLIFSLFYTLETSSCSFPRLPRCSKKFGS